MKAKNPKGRSTDAKMDEHLAEALVVISNRPTVHRAHLHKEFMKRWGCSWRTVDRIVSRARTELAARLGRPREAFRCDSLNFYEAKTQDPKASVGDQIRARQRIDELLGLDAPRRSEISGPDGEALQIQAQVDPDALELLSEEHISGILDRIIASRKEPGPIIKLAGARPGVEPGPP